MPWLGWFGTSESLDQTHPPSRQDRQKCWESRDTYFSCLDAAGVLKPGDEARKCAAENAGYQQNCAKSWIDYFNKRRVLAEQQKSILTQAGVQAQEAKRKTS